MFDIVGGTSIGGILALACTGTKNGGKTPIANSDEIVQIFDLYGTKIFNGNGKIK